MKLPATTKRVSKHTSSKVNARIQREMEERVSYYAEHPEEIDQRLEELDKEWDIERKLEANASALAFLGTVLGVTVNRRFFWVPAMVTGFLAQHAWQGWCPPVPVFRRLGTKTATEIDEERYALKYLRGDFQSLEKNMSQRARAQEALQATKA